MMKTLHLSILTVIGISSIVSLGMVFLFITPPMKQSISQPVSDETFSSLPVIHPQRCEDYQNNMICHGMNMEIDNHNRNYDASQVTITQTEP